MDKECNLIMLSIHKESIIYLDLDNRLCEKYRPQYPNVMGIGKPQFLYITSNEVIKEGDWFIFFGNQGSTLHQYHSDAGYGVKTFTEYNEKDGSSLILSGSKCSGKIIATTDSSLRHSIKDISLISGVNTQENIFNPYPYSIPQSFITHFVTEYNKGNVISKVMVEYEQILEHCDIPLMECFTHNNRGIKCDICVSSSKHQAGLQLKLNPDNTINIRLVKDSWTREEVKFIATRFAHTCRLNQVVTNKETCELFDTWFKQIRKDL